MRIDTVSAFASVALVTALVSCGPRGDSAADIILDEDDIGGVVTSAAGPEAGVWVIAETDDLDTR
ncbi:MAG: hypothetical protein ACKVIN_07635, partial [Longimicrobiales bacterium]